MEQITPPRRMPWTGRASQFEDIIRSRFEPWDTGRLFRYGNSAGMLLRSLSAKHPERVEIDTIVRGVGSLIYLSEILANPNPKSDI